MMPNSSIIVAARKFFSAVPGIPFRKAKTATLADKAAAQDEVKQTASDTLSTAPISHLSRRSTETAAPTVVIREPSTRRSASSGSASPSPSPTPTPPPSPPRPPSPPLPVELTDEQVAAKIRQAQRRLGVGIQICTIDQTTLDDLNAIIEQQPSNIEALTLRALAYRIRLHLGECLEDCDRILALDPQNRFALLHRAATCSTGKTEVSFKKERDAIEEGKSWASQHPEDRFGVFISCLRLNGVEDYKRAESALMDVLAKNPQDECAATVMLALYTRWARLGESQRLKNASVFVAKKVLAINHKNPTANLVLGPPARILDLYIRTEHNDLETSVFAKFPIAAQDHSLAAMLNHESTPGFEIGTSGIELAL